MRIAINIDGQEHKSIEKPKMKHLRVGGRLMAMQEKASEEPGMMQGYLEEVYGYIKDTFPSINDADIDCMSTEKFTELIGEIAAWANGGQGNHQKKS